MNSVELFCKYDYERSLSGAEHRTYILCPGRGCSAIQLRIGKDLITKRCIEKEFGERLLSHFKFLASNGYRREEKTIKMIIVFTN